MKPRSQTDSAYFFSARQFRRRGMASRQNALLGNQRGQSLVQILVSVGLMGIVMTAFTSMVTNQQRETSALRQKLASTDLEKLLQTSLADGSVCKYIVNNPTILTFDSTKVSPSTPQVITPTLPIYASVQSGPPVVTGPVVAQVGQTASAYSSSPIIQSITLSITGAPSPLPAPSPGVTFTGNWLVSFGSENLVRVLAPIRVATTLTVDTTIPSAAVITACQDGFGNGCWVYGPGGLTETTCGNVGIGTLSPGSGTKLAVTGQIAGSSSSVSTSTIDFSLGNAISTSFNCSSSINFANLRDGGNYSLAVTNGGTTQCSFNTATTGDDAGTVNYRFYPANGARTSGTHTVYSLMRIGGTVYVSWITGF